MVRPHRNISSESSDSSKASIDHAADNMKDKENYSNNFDCNDEESLPLSAILGVKLDPQQMVILSGQSNLYLIWGKFTLVGNLPF